MDPPLDCAEKTSHLDRLLLRFPANTFIVSLQISATFPQSYEWASCYSKIHITKKWSHNRQLSTIVYTEGQFYFAQRFTHDQRDSEKDGGGHRQGLGLALYICFCHKGHFPLKCLNLHVLLVVDFHELPSEIGEEKHVNIPLRNSLLSKITF